jgi:hypothetical protein
MLHIKPQLAALEGVNAYSDAGATAKDYFHLEGKKFLRDLAKEIGIPAGTFDIRSNKGGIAVSGEVTLHSDTLYVQLHESAMRPGIDILFRSCKGRGDYTGNQNFSASLPLLFTSTLERDEFVTRLARLGGYA